MRESVLKKLFSFLFFSVCCIPLFGQTRDGSGQVKDNEGTPLEGVTVVGAGLSVTTSATGIFVLKAQPVGDELVFSAIGYHKQSLRVPAEGQLDVILLKEQTDLE